MKKETGRDGEIGIEADIGMGAGRGGGAGWNGISLRNLRTFSSFKNSVYRFYFGGLLGQMAGMQMQMLARSLLVYRLTGSAAILGAISLANAVTMLPLSLYGGVIADRVQKKYVLLVGQAGSAVVSLGIALTITLGYLSAERAGSWWILVVCSVFQGAIQGLMMPSRQTIVQEIVGEEELMNAVSLTTTGMNSLRLFAPAFTGFLIDAIGFAAVYYTMTGMYLMAVVFTAFMPLTGTIAIRGGGALADIKEGLNYVRHETTILFLLVFSLFAVVLAMPYMMLMPVFTEDVLKVSASRLGVLISVSGTGAIIGSLILASMPNRKRGFMLLASSLVLGLALMSFSFSTSWNLSLTLIIFVGLGQAGRMSLSNTLLQYYSEDEYRGRVMSIYMMEFSLQSFSTFAAGVLAEAVGIQWAIGGFAMILVFVSTMALLFVPGIRKLE